MHIYHNFLVILGLDVKLYFTQTGRLVLKPQVQPTCIEVYFVNTSNSVIKVLPCGLLPAYRIP